MPRNLPQTQDRFYPVPPPILYDALQRAIGTAFKVKGQDHLTSTLTFSSGASAFTWGENFTAQVVPAAGGATVRVYGVGKVPGQIAQSGRTHKLIEQVYSALAQQLSLPAFAEAINAAKAATAQRECPHCKEQMRRDAGTCPHCRLESKPWRFHESHWWVETSSGNQVWLDEQANIWKNAGEV
jgi:hypothetical protein